MSSPLQNNPFSALFTSVSEAENYTQLPLTLTGLSCGETVELCEGKTSIENDVNRPITQSDKSTCNSNVNEKNHLNNEVKDVHEFDINQIVERVFQITLNKTQRKGPNTTKHLVYLEELACAVAPQNWIDLQTLEQALFERILLDQPINYAVFKSNENHTSYDHAYQRKVFLYLFECHRRLVELDSKCDPGPEKDAISKMLEFVSRNAVTALKQPDLFESQNFEPQIIELFEDENISVSELSSFFGRIGNVFLDDDGDDCVDALKTALEPTFCSVYKAIVNSSLFAFNHSYFKLLLTFANNDQLGLAVLAYSSPQNRNSGRAYADTLLGSMLCLSCLPKSPLGEFDYFDKNWGSHDGMSRMEENVWQSIRAIQQYAYEIFHSLLKRSPEVKHKMLSWIGDCLHANAGRGRLENLSFTFPSQSSLLCVPDSFMINLSGVLLRLCQPFCGNAQNPKLLRIDPTYCAVGEVNEEQAKAKGIHLHSMAEETCLIPIAEGKTKPVAESFGFVTECFFMTHRALDLGFRVVIEGLSHLNREMSRIDHILQSSNVPRPEMLQVLQARLNDGIQKFKSYRASLLEPIALDMMAHFHIATAVWLAQVNVTEAYVPGQKSFAPNSFITVNFPLHQQVPDTLSCVPEFLIENKCCFLIFVRRFSPRTLEDHGFALLNPLLTQILLFMGSMERMRNPHLRARMAEALEALLPDQQDYNQYPRQAVVVVPSFYRERLFKEHPHRKQIIGALLNVFVGIEMTGQSVEFEQKFNYRRPMYLVMKYLWNLEEHKESFRELAIEAESNMEAVSPPIFLRFINLLINDAVFLLDEALSNMAQLRQMQTARDAGEWERQPLSEREQNENSLLHTGMIARFDNILGCETIQTLLFLTSDITTIFTHPTMVDRIASMLNYFLYNLVGPKMKNFKVKDQKDFEFEPAQIVRFICEIYVHLYKSDSFCLAVSQDGRSYSPQLFKLAEDVLARTGQGSLIADLQAAAAKVAEMASKQQSEDELLAEAPDEFLDPIMNTLMIDPVILPSSHATVDRSTIARHILSDQTDPFNRSPLTMDMVTPNIALKSQIEAWVLEKREQKMSGGSNN